MRQHTVTEMLARASGRLASSPHLLPRRRVGVLDGDPDARLQPGTPRRLGRRHNPDVRARGAPVLNNGDTAYPKSTPSMSAAGVMSGRRSMRNELPRPRREAMAGTSSAI